MSISSSQQSQVNELDLQQNKWIRIKFGDIAEEVKNRVDIPSESGYERFVGGDHLDSGDLTIKRWGSTNDVQAQKLLFKKGDILFGKRNAYLRKVAYADFDGVCSAHMMVLKPRTENIDERFFPHFMQSDQFWERALMISEGSMSPTIKWKVLEKQEFLIPSKDEQRCIAKILWAAEDVIVKNEQFVSAAEHYKQLMIRELFHKGIGHTEFKEIKRVGLIPKDWQVLKLQDIVKKEKPITYGIVQAGPHVPDGVPYLRSSDLNGESIILEDLLRTSDEIAEAYKRSEVYPGDIVFSLRGNIGETKIIPEFLKRANLTQGTARISCSKSYNRYYINYSLQSEKVRKRILSVTKGTTFKEISLEELRKIQIPIPFLDEQQKIASILISIDNLISTANSAVKSSRTLKMKLINTLLSPTEGDEN